MSQQLPIAKTGFRIELRLFNDWLKNLLNWKKKKLIRLSKYKSSREIYKKVLREYRFEDYLRVYIFRKSRDFSIYNLIVLIVIKIETF